MSASIFAAVGVGAVLGAWVRWGLATWLNPLVPNLPMGTLVANVAGGYLVGVAVAFFAAHSALAPEWRLACVTGFLGALTTFSTFSAETVQMLLRQQYAWAGATVALHVLGSFSMTVLGLVSLRTLRTAFA